MQRHSGYRLVVLTLITSSCGLERAYAVDPNLQIALKEIGDSAIDICGTVPLEQTAQGTVFTGHAKAQLSGLFRFISNLGFSADGSQTDQHSYGVLQKDLSGVMTNISACKLQVFKTLAPMLLAGQGAGDGVSSGAEANTPGQNKETFWANNGDIFINNNGTWEEKTTNGQCCSYTFKEVGRTHDYIELDDSSRSMRLRLPIPSGYATWRLYTQSSWNAWLNVVQHS